MKQHLLPVLAAAACLSLTGCGFLSSAWDTIGDKWNSTEKAVGRHVPTFLKVYRPDVTQGNLITEEMCQHLMVGMNRTQVTTLVGTPLITDPFHKNRWDYTFYVNKLNGEEISRHLTIWFDDANVVTKIDRDAMPTETEADEMALGRRKMNDLKEATASKAKDEASKPQASKAP